MFAGMDWPGRERLLSVMAEAGVLWLQLTGGEPLIDPLFAETHAAAWDMGMMIQISSNGSRLDQPRTLDLLTARRPYRLTLSLYGATEESYDGMTRRRGSFKRFMRGLAAAHEAGLAMRINIVVSNRNAHERRRYEGDRRPVRHPVVRVHQHHPDHPRHGRGPAQPGPRDAPQAQRPTPGATPGSPTSTPTPTARPVICKVGRDPQVDLIAEGADGLRKLAVAADSLTHPARRVHRLRPPEDLRDLHAAGDPLPPGQRPARNLLPARQWAASSPDHEGR